MILHHFFLAIHLIAACIWVGGHLILLIQIYPHALRKKDSELLLAFEKKYEYIGMPALIIAVITGLWMAYDLGYTFSEWFTLSTPINATITLKLGCLILTILCAIIANIFVLPHLEHNNYIALKRMGYLISIVSLCAVLFVILGSYLRYGGILWFTK